MTREDLIGHIEDAAYDGITDVAVSHVHKLFDELDKLRAEVAEARKAREKPINERDAAREALRKLLLSRDAAWSGGHDWEEAVDEAICVLGAVGSKK